jgi:hypothetical protein
MKVICLTHEDFTGGIGEDGPKPDIGEICTVIGEMNVNFDCYILAEYPHPNPNWHRGYDKRNFSPLSGIDETELVNEKEEAYG